MLKAYIDVDWTGSVDDQKSTSGGAFFLGDKLVSQFSKKQDSIFSIYCRSKIYCNDILLYSGNVDEINYEGYQGNIL